MDYKNTLFRIVTLTFCLAGFSFVCEAQTEQSELHQYTESNDEDFTSSISSHHKNSELKQEEHHLEHKKEEHHNRYELEISYNNAGNYEFTGSIYFAHLTKFQGTIEFTGKHYATVVVREIPIGHSRWGTFVGVGGTFGFHDHEVPSDHDEHYLDVELHDAPHPDDYNTSDVETHREWVGSVIVQTGLAYSINRHWSTGFTLSPGVDVQSGEPTFGATIDVVFGF
ncbi:hypothetical protein [Flammeovirga sp. SJP92]|uniref:hypothetical protein n=1 Tax=Flammeovirga sp. SJP92 TaxID=1775430 RepID=UPI000787E118|nr:hypothetical protein [Flammeovirga sp. SJP92]KXX69897.1 hypothetical protein AVL50_13525 [Flammeovirga sp. SJP92]